MKRSILLILKMSSKNGNEIGRMAVLFNEVIIFDLEEVLKSSRPVCIMLFGASWEWQFFFNFAKLKTNKQKKNVKTKLIESKVK